jgi:hypothetical protein
MIEQPPSSIPAELREYLVRTFQLLDIRIEQAGIVPKYDKLPTDGNVQFVYFTQAISPSIPAAGLYYYNGTTWVAV